MYNFIYLKEVIFRLDSIVILKENLISLICQVKKRYTINIVNIVIIIIKYVIKQPYNNIIRI
ncbi:hypothetical protein A9CBEGH2_11560 [Amedibacterium intestinale]|uniref:Uncharacterized protein n=1 Tax=Amedibacterium intestinale TaxID=2583452 RepID=A0A6N4TG42_9FIRM|nr:hypothetical protein Aargi30884_10390 [Amedibacterium intestinale]BBK62216.1 hypothetical protein A9CBEGH2_11560 [Amedibacterium intestinale]